MPIDTLKQEATNGVLSMLPKMFVITAGGNMLVGGLAVGEIISWLAPIGTLIALWIVTSYTIKIKKRSLALLDIELEDKQRQREIERSNG